jgi:similar to stage IV sporulation protein
MSLYVWNISFEGNYSYTDVELLRFLKKYNVENGILKKYVDCEDIEYLLRTTYDDITWVSAEIKGTRIIVHIKENFDTYIAKAEDKPYNILSDTKGTVESIVTRSGTPLVKAGDEVEVGQMLVSGILELYSDEGDIINYHLVNADSDIYIRSTQEYYDEFSMEYDKKVYSGKKNKIFQINILQKSLYLSGIQRKFKNYDVVNDYYYMTITDNYYLPFGYNKICIKEYNVQRSVYSDYEAKTIMSERLDNYIRDLNKKDIQIIENNVTIEIENDKCVARGNIVLVKRTGNIEYINENDIPNIVTENESEDT